MANGLNLAVAISGGGQAYQGGQPGAVHHHHHHHHDNDCDSDNKPEKPERNKFLDFLSAPLQAIGLKGGNQNDKQYDKYLQANQAGNLLKG